MTESERIIQRYELEIMLKDFSKEDFKEIENNIIELKTILNSEELSKETIAILIFLYKKNKDAK